MTDEYDESNDESTMSLIDLFAANSGKLRKNYRILIKPLAVLNSKHNFNAKTEPYYFPPSDATDVYHYNRGSRYYSSVDFRDAFFTVELAEEN